MKFWEIKNKDDSETADLLLYGPISDSTWWGDEVTPKQFASDLNALEGKNVRVCINSPGGDVFAAHAIYNQLVNYAGDVTIHVDGLAASAATIIMMAGNVIMPSNSMVMIHNPAVGLLGYYDADQMVKMAADLEKIKQSIMSAYKTKSNLDDKKLSKLMDEETWMTAEEAKEYGFADEVTGISNAVNMAMDGSFLVVNSVRHDLSRIKNASQLKKMVNQVKPKKEPKEEVKQVKTIDELKQSHPELVNQLVNQAIESERGRITALDALDDKENPAVHELVNSAKIGGKSADEIKPVIDIIKKHAPNATDTKNAQEHFEKVINDNKASGVDNVKATGGDGNADERQETADAINFMAGIINKKNGVKK